MARRQTQIFLLKKKESYLSPEHMRSYHLPSKEKKARGAIGSSTGMVLALSSVLILDTGGRTCLSTAHSVLFPEPRRQAQTQHCPVCLCPAVTWRQTIPLRSMDGEIGWRLGGFPVLPRHIHTSPQDVPKGKEHGASEVGGLGPTPQANCFIFQSLNFSMCKMKLRNNFKSNGAA